MNVVVYSLFRTGAISGLYQFAVRDLGYFQAFFFLFCFHVRMVIGQVSLSLSLSLALSLSLSLSQTWPHSSLQTSGWQGEGWGNGKVTPEEVSGCSQQTLLASPPCMLMRLLSATEGLPTVTEREREREI